MPTPLEKIQVADKLFENEQYQEAYDLYDESNAELLQALKDSSTARKVAKGAGWVAALLTGGFGLEDLIIVPVVNKLLLNLLGVDLEQTLAGIYHNSIQKLIIMGTSSDIFASRSFKTVLLDSLLCYRLIYDKKNSGFLSSVVELVNPLAEGILTGDEGNISESDLMVLLYKEVTRPGEQIEYINNLLFFFLIAKNETSNYLYAFLRKGRERTEEEFSNGGRFVNADEEKRKAEYYGSIFGLKGTITKSELRKRYRDLMKEYHPDKFANASPAQKHEAEEKAKKINEAWAYFKQKYSV